jgi:hypothetical protein
MKLSQVKGQSHFMRIWKRRSLVAVLIQIDLPRIDCETDLGRKFASIRLKVNLWGGELSPQVKHFAAP